MKILTITLQILIPAYDVVFKTSLNSQLIHKRSFQLEILYRYIPMTFFLNWLYNLIPFVGYLIMPTLILIGVWHIGTHSKIIDTVRTRLLFLIIAQWAFLGIWSFVGHTILADFVATSIGWQTGSPFQIELAFYHLGTALAAFSLLWNKSASNILTVVLVKSTFLFGAMGVHIYHFFAKQNLNANNIGMGIIYADLVVPLLVIWLWIKLNK